MNKAKFADGLTIAFLILTVSHSANVLIPSEKWEPLAWGLAIAVDAATAYAAFVATDSKLKKGPRIWAGVWLAGLLVVGYGFNYAYYATTDARGWAWALSLIFPLSLAVLGAIKSGLLSKEDAPEGLPDATTPGGEDAPALKDMLAEMQKQLTARMQERDAAMQQWTSQMQGWMQSQMQAVDEKLAAQRQELASERGTLIRELEGRLGAATRTFASRAQTAPRSIAPDASETGAADGGNPGPEYYRMQFQADPSARILQEAWLAGVKERTLQSWVARYGNGMQWGEIASEVKAARTMDVTTAMQE